MPFLFQRVDLLGARTGGLPPIGGSPSRGARIFQKEKKIFGKILPIFGGIGILEILSLDLERESRKILKTS